MKTMTIPSYREGLKELKENTSRMLSAHAGDVFNLDAEGLRKEHTSILKLQVGEKAPNFTLLNTFNECINLYNVLQTKRVVLTFYRGTWCPYCNLILSQYQTVLPEIEKAGATLIAISPQTPDESLNIKEKNALQFEVLSDNGNIVSKEFTTIHKNPKKSLDKMTELGYNYDSYYSDEGSAIPIPATFIIEKNGTVSFTKTEGGDYRNRVESSDIIAALNK
ncbi:AhpC/TSA family protein [Aquimarina sp. AD10]|uniref:thioredoxin-dependent peroxiredoxin n=1 Tax=Aquimarina aggregata TaxID=1642818 RepID=A0A163A6X5_9FLAO|nr:MULTISPECIES: peroxiredoxin-like family protein [Aquimarina]AXT63359.1 AhpC/TSA family protein [Aquimarina sp. AD10]KZS40309.1 redoxin [Aquimarina aggregata]RKN00628.1 AhpC/TSA family protein [Aquimarina sp. AD10]